MRSSVAITIACLALVGLAAADESQAAIKQHTDIPAEDLGLALQTLAKERGFQVVYVTDEVKSLQTQGASGDLTQQEALTQLLRGTGLTYRYLNDNGVSIDQIRDVPTPDKSGAGPAAPSVPPPADTGNEKKIEERKKGFLDRFRLAQVDQGASSDGPPAQQPPQAAAQEATSITTVVVTGSRIPVPLNITATSPIQVVTSQEFELQGTTDTTNMINRLPQNIIGAGVDLGNNSAALNAAGGISTADLRGLGPQRTLVLVDGRRLGPGDPNTSNPNVASDLDQVPAPLIERIDVVTGGASATYGSDAIAGVVNFIMKKNFEGIEVNGEYGLYQHSNHNGWVQTDAASNDFAPVRGSLTDGDHRDWSIVMGTNLAGGDGNVTAYLTYHEQDPVPGSHRDFSNCQLVSNAEFGLPANGLTCIGSSNSNKFTINNSPYSVVGNSFLPYPQAGSVPPPEFNSSAFEYIQRQDKRYNAGFFAHLDVNEQVKPYVEFGFMNDKTNIVVAPSALFQTSNPITADNRYLVNCSNPLLSAQEREIMCTPAMIAADTAVPGSDSADIDIGRRNVEGGGRLADFEHTNYRIVVGSKGALGNALDYDAYAQYAYTSFYNDNENYLDYASVTKALQATTGPGGTPVCISGGSCVPYNIFTQGGVTAAQTQYLSTPGTAFGQNWEEVEHGDITADLGKFNITSPWAKDGIAINLGAEHRLEALKFAPDGAEQSGNLSGFSGAVVAIDRGYTVTEEIAEIRAPLVLDRPGIHDLTIDAGYRLSDYTTAGRTRTYKFETQYAPTADVRLRASYDRAVRAPNLIELYNPNSYGQQSFVGVDACAPTTGAGGVITQAATASAAECAHTGVSAAQYGNGNEAGAVYTGSIPQCVSLQCGQVIGGNPALKPETADTYSVGLTFTPTMLPAFNGSIDYYHIALKNEVTTPPGAFIYTECLATGNPQDCDLIVRNHVTGALTGATVAGGGYILQTDINGGAALVSGVDVQANYRLPLGGFGALTANFSGSWLQHDEITPFVGLHTFDCAGLFGSTCAFAVNPRWRHNFRLSWETPWDKLLVSLYWRFIGPTSVDNNSSDPSLHFRELGEIDTYDHIPTYSYFDLSAIWPVTPKIELRAGVNNLFDKDPPIVAQDFNDGTSPNSFPTYDYLGREIFMGFKVHF
jgi:outer membrane receptor protein involved in Fe transport